MKVGITQRMTSSKNGALIDSLEQDYVEYYSKFEVDLVPMPNVLESPEDYVKELGIERIILSGGGEINKDQLARDNTEKKLLVMAIQNKIPVLGVCRGCQFINAFFGGTILNIKEDYHSSIEHVASTHEIKITDDRVIKYLSKDTFQVNSYHNNGFTNAQLGEGLQVFALSPDQVIEGIYRQDSPVAAVMWHPERDLKEDLLNEQLIGAFIEGGLFWQ